MNNKGFTLLEMIVVVMIISILFLLTIPNVAGVMDSIDNKTCNALTKVVDNAVVQFKLEYGQYPNSITDLVSAGYITDDQTKCSNGKELYLLDNQTSYD